MQSYEKTFKQRAESFENVTILSVVDSFVNENAKKNIRY